MRDYRGSQENTRGYRRLQLVEWGLVTTGGHRVNENNRLFSFILELFSFILHFIYKTFHFLIFCFIGNSY